MLNFIDLRLAHYSTRVPILIELKVHKDATVRQLRAQINDVMQADEHCLMRVFGRLFVEMQAGAVKRLSAIEPGDEGESLLRLGIEDGDVLYLEGPLTSSPEGVGMAIAVLSAQGQLLSAEVAAQIKHLEKILQQLSDNVEKVKQQSAEHALQTKQLQAESIAQRQLILRLSEEICALTKQNERIEARTSKSTNPQALVTQRQAVGLQDVTPFRSVLEKFGNLSDEKVHHSIYWRLTKVNAPLPLDTSISASFKLLLVGDSNVGKTAFVKQRLTGKFEENNLATVGVNVVPLCFATSHGSVCFNCWDIAGRDMFTSLRYGYYLNGNAAIIMFDASRSEFPRNMVNWHRDIVRMTDSDSIPIVYVGSKVCEEQTPRVVRPRALLGFRRTKLVCYFEVSSKIGYNTTAPFHYLLKFLANDREVSLSPDHTPTSFVVTYADVHRLVTFGRLVGFDNLKRTQSTCQTQ